MKLVTLPVTRVNRESLDSALDAVFGPHMLRRVHGPNTVVGPFVDDQRSFQFTVDVPPRVPWLLRRFLCGSNQLRVTTHQTLSKESSHRWTVTNRLKIHCVGAELFRMQPVFWLEHRVEHRVEHRDGRNDDSVFLGGQVRHDASLPPLLSHVAERFMASRTTAELQRFAQCLKEEGVV